MDTILETERLILRKPTLDDVEGLQEVINDIRIAGTTLNIPHPYSVEDAKSWIERQQKGTVSRDTVNSSFFLKESGKLIGGIGLSDISPYHQKAEIGYWCGYEHWGNGFTTEASRAMIEYGFNELKLERIYAICFATNTASVRVMEKIGMVFEGTARNEYKKDGKFVDFHHYAILRDDFQAPG